MNPTALFKLLADETRLKTTLLICLERELCVCEIMEALSESQPKVSRHLAQLKASELLLDRKQKQWVFYRINPNLQEWIHSVVETTLQNNPDFLNEERERLKTMGDRPQRSAELCC